MIGNNFGSPPPPDLRSRPRCRAARALLLACVAARLLKGASAAAPRAVQAAHFVAGARGSSPATCMLVYNQSHCGGPEQCAAPVEIACALDPSDAEGAPPPPGDCSGASLRSRLLLMFGVLCERDAGDGCCDVGGGASARATCGQLTLARPGDAPQLLWGWSPPAWVGRVGVPLGAGLVLAACCCCCTLPNICPRMCRPSDADSDSDDDGDDADGDDVLPAPPRQGDAVV